MPKTAQSRTRVTQTLAWFERNARALPWRDPDCSAWGVLVSEVMLQQTPVSRVQPVWEEWMARWPTPTDLADASLDQVLRAWGRLGYPRRAKRLRECARMLVERHGGEVPRDQGMLMALPGIGEYTAAAVCSFAFGQHALVLDTNVRRVIARAWSGRFLPVAHLTRAERELAFSIVPSHPPDAAAWNAAAMELGALVCQARMPMCHECPLVHSCAWVTAGRPRPEAGAARVQAWAGTDRQVRGAVMALLRQAPGPVHVASADDLARFPDEQRARCVASLITDGLISEDPQRPGWFVLGGS